MRPVLTGYLLGLASALFLLFSAGGEAVTQFGLRMSAASTHYDWSAVPHADAAPVLVVRKARR